MFVWHTFSCPALSNKSWSFALICFHIAQEKTGSIPNTLSNGGFTTPAILIVSFFLDTLKDFPSFSPGQYTIKILTMQESMSFFFEVEGQLWIGCQKREEVGYSAILTKRTCSGKKHKEVDNWENDSCSIICILKIGEHWFSTSRTQITRKEVTVSSHLLSKRMRPINTAATWIIRQQIYF